MVFLTNSVLLHLTKTGPSVHQQFIHAGKIFHTRSSTLVQHLMRRDLNPQHNIERNNVFDARHWTPCGLEFPSVNPRCHLSKKNIINSSTSTSSSPSPAKIHCTKPWAGMFSSSSQDFGIPQGLRHFGQAISLVH